MNDYIRSIKNLNTDDKVKTKEQYEIITNVSMQEIKRLELRIKKEEETIDGRRRGELDIKIFLKYLKYFNMVIPGKIFFPPNYFNEKFNLNKYCNHWDFYEEMGGLIRGVRKKIYEREIIKSKQKEIHQEKFKMCIHKLKLSLPNNLIYEIGTYL